MSEELFDFTGLPPPKKKKEVVDDVRNILILELPGTKEGEMELRKIFEELRDRGYKCKLMN
jgi:SepF-like predicted cell division protein (DUF552 family)